MNFISIRREDVQKLKENQYIVIDGEPCVIKSTEHSKAGKHGHAKVRIMCIGLFDGSKRSLAVVSGHQVEVPEILKGNAQINFIEENLINIMDLQTYESMSVEWPKDEQLVGKLKELQKDPAHLSEKQVEFWKLMGKVLINRIYGD